MADSSSTSTSTPSATYSGNCHCALVSFTITLSPPLEDQAATRCNCSICTKHGLHLVYAPRSACTVSGEEHLKTYEFAEKAINHEFCRECGVEVLVRPKDEKAYGGIMGVNVRTFKKIDLDKVKFKDVDYKSKGVPYPHDD